MLQHFNVKSAVETFIICSQMAYKQEEVKSAEESYSVRSICTRLLPESIFKGSVSQATDTF